MKISRIGLKNWRNFQHADAALQDRTFLVGPNAAGKSNFLDVFRFLRDIAKAGGGLQKAVEDRGGLGKIRCLAARKDPTVEISIELIEEGEPTTHWRYLIGIQQEPRGFRQPYLAYERVWKNGQVVLNRPDAPDRSDRLRLTQTHLEQINSNEGFRPVARFLEVVLYLHLVPQLVKNPDAFAGPNLPGDPFGRNFLDRIAQTPERARQARLRKIEAVLKVAVPQFKQLTHMRDERGTSHLEVIYQHWRPHGARQREDQFSDGTLRLTGLLWSLLESDSLLLLEEPELSLNAGVVRQLAPLIHRVQRARQRQVIISTHSYELLSDKGIDPGEVLMLTPAQGVGTKVEPASTDAEIEALLEGGMNLAEAIFPRLVARDVHQLQMELFN